MKFTPMLKSLLISVLLLVSFAAQATVYSLPWGPKPQFVDANGAPMSSGTVTFYAAGSTTPQNTYTDSTGGVANSNPITLNTRGETPNEVWLTGSSTYKIVLKDSSGSTVWTVDNISGINDITISNAPSEWISGPTPTYVSATQFTLAGDQTLTFTVGRRVRTTNSGGTVYSTISASVYGAVTTVTVVNDTSTLDSGLSAVSYGMLASANQSSPPATDIYPQFQNNSDRTKQAKISLSNQATGVTTTLVAPGLQASGSVAIGGHAQAQLQYVGTTSIKLVPFKGQQIQINGAIYLIPSAGVTLANTGLTTATKYYIYAFMSSGTMTLEASATAYATDSTAGNVGVVVKSGDGTRTLVGMVYMDAGVPGTFASTATKQWVRSYFNDPGLAGNSGLTASKTSASATFVELDNTVRIQFIPWADEYVYTGATGLFSNATSGNPYYAALGYDGTTPEDGVTGNNNANNGIPTPWALTTPPKLLSEANHYLTLLGASTGGITGTWYGAAAPSTSTPAQRCTWWLRSSRSY